MIFHQGKRVEMQTRRQGDAVDPCVQPGSQAHAQGVLGGVHRQLLHAVDEDHAVATLGFHGPAHMQLRRLGQLTQVELHR